MEVQITWKYNAFLKTAIHSHLT